MTATLNSIPLLKAEIREPRIGAWTAELDVDSETAITGALELVIEGVTWRGFVVRGDVYAGHAHVKAVGGHGGLSKTLDAKYYVSSTLGAVIADMMSETGEILSPTTDASVLAHTAPRWSRSQGPMGLSLAQVAVETSKAAWRVLRDGTVWIGTETWPTLDLVVDETHKQPNRGTNVIAPDAPTALPGVTLGGRRISQVTTVFESGALRQEIHYEDDNAPAGGLDRLRSMMASTVEAFVGKRIDYAKMYPAKVIHQAGDGTVDVYADDAKIRGNGITQVPLRHGLPGCTVLVKPGERVNIYFENGDPKSPVAALWPDGSSVLQITFTPDVKLVINGDLEVTGEVTAKSATTPVKLSTHLHPTAMGPTSAPTPGT